MSIILDALRKVEQEKRLQQHPQIDIKQRLLQDKKFTSNISPGTNIMLLGVAAIVLFAATISGAYWLVNGNGTHATMPVPRSNAPVVAVIKQPEAAMPVSAAVPAEEVVNLTVAKTRAEKPGELREPSGRGIEKDRRPSSQPAPRYEQVEKRDWPRENEEEVFSDRAASPLHQGKKDVAAGTEPPVARQRAQAAPVPVVLDGIIFHTDPTKRSALIRLASQPSSSLVKIGDEFGGYRIEIIDQNKVGISVGNKLVELRLE